MTKAKELSELASATTVTSGNVALSGGLDVDGVTNLDVVDIDGAVNMATTALVTGVVTANGGAVFNEGSADVDFRVKSNGNANMLFVDGGNNTVAIGTSDTDFDPVADNLIVGTGGGSNGITIYTGSSAGSKGSIFFADTAAGNAANSRKGQITYEQNNEIMTFFTNNSLTLTLALNGSATIANGLTLTDGNLVVANTHGIDFAAQTASNATGVSSSKGELLDHYEQGAFTPIFQNSGGEQINYAFAAGFYVRVGARVHAHGYLGGGGNALNTGTSNDLQLGGLPFDAVNVTNGHASVNFGYGANLNIAAGVNVTGYLGPNTTLISVQKWSSAVGTTNLTFGELSTDGRLMFSLSYNAV